MKDERKPFVNSGSWITMFADASHCPDTGAVGWCCWIKYGLPPETAVIDGDAVASNSRDAEVLALENGLDFLDSFPDEWLEDKRLNVQSDCVGALEVIEGRLRTMRVERRMKSAYTKHVRGHRGNACARSYINELCDSKAKEKMRAKRAQLRAK